MTNGEDFINFISCKAVSGDNLRLTKRELFAAIAMQGLLANYVEHGMYGNSPSYPMVEESAVKCADQLISELNKPNKP